MATDKLNELFPPHELIAMGYLSKDETEQIAYFDAFEQARDVINDTLESAIDAINLAENSQEIESTLDYNAQIAAL